MPELSEAVDCIFGPGADPVVVTCDAHHQNHLVRLRYAQQHELREYVIAAQPLWWQGDMSLLNRSDIFVPGDKLEAARAQGRFATSVHCCSFPRQSNLLVIECDYLLVPGHPNECPFVGDDDPDKIPSQEAKAAQANAVTQALIQTKFPYSCLVHSGSKSIHIYVRLDQPVMERPALVGGFANCPEEYLAERSARQEHNDHLRETGTNRRWLLLQEALRLALGDYDIKVFEGAGLGWKTRMPGAVRSNGETQHILACDPQPRTVNELYQWARDQLEKRSCLPWLEDPKRVPVGYRNGEISAVLDLRKWRARVCRRVAQGFGGHGIDSARNQWLSASAYLVATQKQPRIRRRPNIEQHDWGDIDAPFLWWVQALGINHFSFPHAAQHPEAPAPYGYVFSGQDWWWKGKDNQGSADLRTVWDSLSEPSFEKARASSDPWIDMWLEQAQQHEADTAQWRAAGAEISQTPLHLRHAAVGENPKRGRSLAKPAAQAAAPVNDEAYEYQRMACMLYHLGQGQPVRYASSKAQPFQSEWVRYNGRYWEPVSNEIAKARALQAFQQYPDKDKNGLPKVPTNDNLTNLVALSMVKDAGSVIYEGEWQQREGAVVFDNGTLYVSRNGCDWHPDHFDPNDLATYALPYPYDRSVPTPLFDHYVATSFSTQWERDVVMRFMGYLFYPSLPFKQFLMMKGATDSGKSTFNNIVTAMVGGDRFTASLDLASMGRDNYWAASLDKARLMVINETASSMAASKDVTAKIKKLTGDDTVNVRKMRKEGFDHRVSGKLVLATNQLPDFRDDSEAFWKRCLLVEPQMPAKLIDGLANRIQEHEMPGVAAKVLDALQLLLAEGGFHKSDEMQDRVAEFRVANTPLIEFWDMHMEPADNEYCSLRAVMEIYNREQGGGQWRNEGRFAESLRTSDLCSVSRRDADWITSHSVHHLHAITTRSAYVIKGWRCIHPAADSVLSPPIPREQEGTAADNRPIPFPRKSFS